MVKAKPLTTWLAFKLIVIKLCNAANKPPPMAAAMMAAKRFSVFMPTINPVTAPTNIIPSSPRFCTPDFVMFIEPLITLHYYLFDKSGVWGSSPENYKRFVQNGAILRF